MLHQRWRLGSFARSLLLVGLVALVIGAAGWSTEAPALAARSPQAHEAHPAPGSTPVALEAVPVFIPDQIIVTGPTNQIDELLDRVAPGIQLQLLRNLDLSYTQRLSPGAPVRFPPGVRAQLVMRLYRSTNGKTVDQVVATLNQRAADLYMNVFADPNYVAKRLGGAVGGDPWSVGGSPAGGTPADAPGDFLEQWAFGPYGIGLYNGINRMVRPTGARVQVFILDTSPFTVPLGTLEAPVTVPWAVPTPTLTLMVSHPVPDAAVSQSSPSVDVRDHGLFVAGLVHGVAPGSQIHLIRVLDEYGHGDLFTLNRALSMVISGALGSPNPTYGTIINLSLGVNRPSDPPAQNLPANLVSLETQVLAAIDLGMVVVAAAGNDSNWTTVQSTQLPAAYPGVVSVAASSRARKRSCFSNSGRVAAPGGDGSIVDCLPQTSVCAVQPGYCVISLVSVPSPNWTGYAYWAGSSFATPMVSGEAALIIEQKHGTVSPAQVADQIYGSAGPPGPSIGAGVINLPRAFGGYDAQH
jgi:subtilisin family serine protease